jgi:hypothetical protein
MGTEESRSPLAASEDFATSWDKLLRELDTWKIRKLEFQSFQNNRWRRRDWIAPATPVAADRYWSLSVSLPDAMGAICELRASRDVPIRDEREVAALTNLLKTSIARFVVHSDLTFGAVDDSVGPVTETYTPQRRAA